MTGGSAYSVGTTCSEGSTQVGTTARLRKGPRPIGEHLVAGHRPIGGARGAFAPQRRGKGRFHQRPRSGRCRHPRASRNRGRTRLARHREEASLVRPRVGRRALRSRSAGLSPRSGSAGTLDHERQSDRSTTWRQADRSSRGRGSRRAVALEYGTTTWLVTQRHRELGPHLHEAAGSIDETLLPACRSTWRC